MPRGRPRGIRSPRYPWVAGARYGACMGAMDDAELVHVDTAAEWRDWLAEHHATSRGAWVVFWRSHTGRPRMSYEDSILEAVAYGWVDGQTRTLDAERGAIWFAPRRPDSPWAASNKRRVAQLEREGRMQPAGRAAVERAKANGRWSVLDGPEQLIEPPELAAALDADPVAREHWNGFTPSSRTGALGWIALARRDDTRARRIAEVVRLAAVGKRVGE